MKRPFFYIVISAEKTEEKRYIGFGLTDRSGHTVRNISPSLSFVIKLRKICNKEDVDPSQLIYICEDAII